MILPPGAVIAGHPAVRIRDMLWNGIDFILTRTYIQRQLKVTGREAGIVASRLLDLGYIEPERHSRADDPTWIVTPSGRRLAHAGAMRPISRLMADRLVRGFLERVDDANADPGFAYRVRRVVAFGSYVSAKEKIGDIDLMVELEPKESDKERQGLRERLRVQDARDGGRRFASFVEEIGWPQIEVRRFLKGGSRYLSLHLPQDAAVARSACRVLYPQPT